MEEEEYCSHCHLNKMKGLFGTSPFIERIKAILITSHTRSCDLDPTMIKIQIAAATFE